MASCQRLIDHGANGVENSSTVSQLQQGMIIEMTRTSRWSAPKADIRRRDEAKVQACEEGLCAAFSRRSYVSTRETPVSPFFQAATSGFEPHNDTLQGYYSSPLTPSGTNTNADKPLVVIHRLFQASGNKTLVSNVRPSLPLLRPHINPLQSNSTPDATP